MGIGGRLTYGQMVSAVWMEEEGIGKRAVRTVCDD